MEILERDACQVLFVAVLSGIFQLHNYADYFAGTLLGDLHVSAIVC